MRGAFSFLFSPKGARFFDRTLIFLSNFVNLIVNLSIIHLFGSERGWRMLIKLSISNYQLLGLIGSTLRIRAPILRFATPYGPICCRMDLSEIASCKDSHERELMRLFTPRRGDTVLDLGAHIGVFTIAAAKLVGPEGTVIAVEPDPEIVAILERNLSDNRLSNVSIVTAAAASEHGRGRLYRWKGISGASSLIGITERGRKADDSIEVNLVNMDDMLEKSGIPFIDWIKMDVQWSDLDVLKSLRRTLQNERIRVFVEVHPGEMIGHDGNKAAAVEGYLKDFGFDLFHIEPHRTTDSYHLLATRRSK